MVQMMMKAATPIFTNGSAKKFPFLLPLRELFDLLENRNLIATLY
jgi:hypothetical protein